jgi:hypothetical protein
VASDGASAWASGRTLGGWEMARIGLVTASGPGHIVAHLDLLWELWRSTKAAVKQTIAAVPTEIELTGPEAAAGAAIQDWQTPATLGARRPSPCRGSL